MSKVQPLVPLTAGFTASTELADRLQKIQNAFDNTLSRDGSSPNQMNSDLDMNTYRIINLPAPSTATEPIRLGDLTPANVVAYIPADASVTNTKLAAGSVSFSKLDSTLSKTPVTLANIAALRAATSSSLGASFVYLFSYYNAFGMNSDGGGGLFIRDDSDITTADNHITVVDASGRRWKRQLEGNPVTPKMFGAYGDGVSRQLSTLFGSLGAAQARYSFVTSLTQEVDYAAVQAAINYAGALYGGGVADMVYLGANTAYNIGSTVLVMRNKSGMIGDSMAGTVINYTGNNFAIRVIGVSNVTLRGFRIGLNGTNSSGIFFATATGQSVLECCTEDIWIVGNSTQGQIGIQLQPTGADIVSACRFRGITIETVDKPIIRAGEGNFWSEITIGTFGFNPAGGNVAVNSATNDDQFQGRIAGTVLGTGNIGYTQGAYGNIDDIIVDIGSNAKAFDYSATGNTVRCYRPEELTLPGTAVEGNTIFDSAGSTVYLPKGTFTPVLAGATTSGTGTYSARSASYQVHGNRVDAQIDVHWTAHTGTGQLTLTGLPFVHAGIANIATAIVFGYNLTYTGELYVAMTAGSSTLSFYTINNGTLAAFNVAASGDIRINLTYQK